MLISLCEPEEEAHDLYAVTSFKEWAKPGGYRSCHDGFFAGRAAVLDCRLAVSYQTLAA
jgi:hypothetical protein